MQKILIIEDEKTIRDELSLLLQNSGYQTLYPDNLDNIIDFIEKNHPELILLDIGLPDEDGFSLCAKIRKSSKIPILFVTSRNSSMDELKALSLGGDDFITKPYNIPVLLARIQAILRRTKQSTDDILNAKGLSLYLAKSQIEYNNIVSDLTKNEAKILWCLMQKPEHVVSRADIIEFLWDNEIYIDDNTLSVNMTRLRGKLDTLGLHDYIKTVRGAGYKI